jgi:hypothetical protein
LPHSRRVLLERFPQLPDHVFQVVGIVSGDGLVDESFDAVLKTTFLHGSERSSSYGSGSARHPGETVAIGTIAQASRAIASGKSAPAPLTLHQTLRSFDVPNQNALWNAQSAIHAFADGIGIQKCRNFKEDSRVSTA